MSKTLTKLGVVTELVRKYFLGIFLASVASLGIFNGLSGLLSNKMQLSAPNGAINIEIVNDEKSRIQGLSGRANIKNNQGMLFEFDDESSQHCFWMKDMLFSIDIVWLNSLKQVVYIKNDVSPDTFPKSYCPGEPAQYVLEVGAGRAKQVGITEKSTLSW